jgi:alpha/beta superfamily hydrolase
LPEILARARQMVAEGKGKQLMVLPGWWWVASAESILDYSDNMPNTLENASRMRLPVLFLRGDQDPEDVYPAETFASQCASPCQAVVVPACDHFYTGNERQVSALVADWLRKTCGLHS